MHKYLKELIYNFDSVKVTKCFSASLGHCFSSRIQKLVNASEIIYYSASQPQFKTFISDNFKLH